MAIRSSIESSGANWNVPRKDAKDSGVVKSKHGITGEVHTD